MERIKSPESELSAGNVLANKAGDIQTDTKNSVPSPPDNPSKKPPMYAGDPHNPNDPEYKKNQPYAGSKS